jgi:hypothetical protein
MLTFRVGIPKGINELLILPKNYELSLFNFSFSIFNRILFL